MSDRFSAKYAVLASVSTKQPYYANGVCKSFTVEPTADFEFLPTDECRETMRKLDCIFKRDEGNAGFVVLARVSGKNGGGDDLVRFMPANGDALTFLVTLRNVDVLNFDDLPTGQYDPNLFYYFNNQRSDAAAARSDLHLSNLSAGVNTDDRIRRSGNLYRYHFGATVASGDAVVKHVTSNIDVAPGSVVNQNGQSDLAFNLAGIPLGKCRLIIDGNIEDEFYYIGVAPKQVFGIVELSLSQSLSANYRVVESDRSLTADRPVYSLLFPSRKTYWRYTVHLQPSSPLYREIAKLSASDKADFLDKLNIVSNDTAVTFTRMSATDTDIVFVSDNELAFQEKYFSSSSMTHDPLRLTLKQYIGVPAKEAVVKSDLSYPQTGLIDATSMPVVYSDIFLTL